MDEWMEVGVASETPLAPVYTLVFSQTDVAAVQRVKIPWVCCLHLSQTFVNIVCKTKRVHE